MNNKSPQGDIENTTLFNGKVVNCRMKAEHKIVWQSLEAANNMWNRAVLISEIVEAFTSEEKALLQRVYTKKLGESVAVILDLLARRNLVFVKRGIRFRYFGSLSLLNPAACVLPKDPLSRRQSVLNLTREAVTFYKRAVRAGDFPEFIKERPDAAHFDQVLIVRDLKSLSETGELKIVSTVRGDGGGLNLYLPSELEPDDYLCGSNLTWLECVLNTFQTVWDERVARATDEDNLPQPITTAEIRSRLEADADPHPRLEEPKAVTNALKSLSETDNPNIRRIKIRATGAVLWVPADVADEQTVIEGGVGSDSNKIAVAVERAVTRLNHPVTAADIKEEIEIDLTLLPTGNQSVAKLLSEISKSKIADGNGGRRERVMSLVRRTGSAGGRSYYATANCDIDKARLYTDYLNCREQWKVLTAFESVDTIETCLLPGVKQGRMLLLQKEANSFRLMFLKILSTEKINSETRRSIEDLLRETERTARAAQQRLRSYSNESLPADVATKVPGLTAAELMKTYRPLYPVINGIKDVNRMIVLCSKYLRRIPSETFTSRFSSASGEAAEHLFDRADALIYAAIKWGGRECRYQALIARHELGLLRDARFVLPDLQSGDYEKRVAAIACLAFLQTEESSKDLCYILQHDPIAEVRRSALWAFAFSKGEATPELAAKVNNNDDNERVRNLAALVAQSEYEKVWFL